MSEIILVVIVLVILFGAQVLVNKIKRPLLHYIRIFAAIALILFVWIFGTEGSISVKVILSALVLTSLYKEYISIRKFQSQN